MRAFKVMLAFALLVALGGCAFGSGDTGQVASALQRDHKAQVCHPAGKSGNLLLLEIDLHAVPAHLAHGDWMAADEEICGDEVDNDCDGVVDEDCDPCEGGKCCPEGENCEEPPPDPCAEGKC